MRLGREARRRATRHLRRLLPQTRRSSMRRRPAHRAFRPREHPKPKPTPKPQPKLRLQATLPHRRIRIICLPSSPTPLHSRVIRLPSRATLLLSRAIPPRHSRACPRRRRRGHPLPTPCLQPSNPSTRPLHTNNTRIWLSGIMALRHHRLTRPRTRRRPRMLLRAIHKTSPHHNRRNHHRRDRRLHPTCRQGRRHRVSL